MVFQSFFIETIVRHHLSHPDEIPDWRKIACHEFLNNYEKIFTTNFDLNLYWVEMSIAERWKREDGFSIDPTNPDSKSLVFNRFNGRRSSINYLHGAVHIFVEMGLIKKHSWKRTGVRLVKLITDALSCKQYPILVCGGTPEQKKGDIVRHDYLGVVRARFKSIQGSLVIYGHSLSENDAHIGEMIAANLDLNKLYVGLHGEVSSPENRALINRIRAIQQMREDFMRLTGKKGNLLEVAFFKSESANVWGAKQPTTIVETADQTSLVA